MCLTAALLLELSPHRHLFAPLSFPISFLFFSSSNSKSFLLSLATPELYGGFAFEDLSGAISPPVNKCCDRRQVGDGLEPD